MKNVIIATTTFYSSLKEPRLDYCSKLINSAKNDGYRIFILDGSPEPEIDQYLKSLGAEVFKATSKGMGPSRRELFAEVRVSMPPDIILWTEPEKDLVNIIPQLVEPIINDKADVSVMRRSQKSLDSYPKFQVGSEMQGNECFKEATGIDADIFSGPIAFRKKLLPYYINFDHTRYGNRVPDTYIQHFATIEVARDMYRIASPEVDFIYPPEQKEEEENQTLEKFREMVEKRLSLQLRPLTKAYFAMGRVCGIRPS